ncbi:MAG: hypothetical protein RLZZ511_863 [Cyanobacteriota bacterium]
MSPGDAEAVGGGAVVGDGQHVGRKVEADDFRLGKFGFELEGHGAGAAAEIEDTAGTDVNLVKQTLPYPGFVRGEGVLGDRVVGDGSFGAEVAVFDAVEVVAGVVVGVGELGIGAGLGFGFPVVQVVEGFDGGAIDQDVFDDRGEVLLEYGVFSHSHGYTLRKPSL